MVGELDPVAGTWREAIRPAVSRSAKTLCPTSTRSILPSKAADAAGIGAENIGEAPGNDQDQSCNHAMTRACRFRKDFISDPE